MQNISFVLKFVKEMVWGLVLQGVIAIGFAIAILVWPAFLNILVAAMLIAIGIVSIGLAFKVNKYSKIEFEL